MIEPGKSSFHYPPFWQYLPTVRFQLLRYFHSQAEIFICFVNEGVAIIAISAYFFQRRISEGCQTCCPISRFRIVQIGFVNHDRQKTTHIVGDDLPFYSFRFFQCQSLSVRQHRSFSRIESRLTLESAFHLNSLFVELFSQGAQESCPKVRSTVLVDKSCAP